MKSEACIQKEIRKALTEAGYLNWRVNVGKVKTEDGRWFTTGMPNGFPDVFGILPDGRMYTIEVKTQTGRLRDDQLAFYKTVLKQHNIVCGVARSVEDALHVVESGECGYGY